MTTFVTLTVEIDVEADSGIEALEIVQDALATDERIVNATVKTNETLIAR